MACDSSPPSVWNLPPGLRALLLLAGLVLPIYANSLDAAWHFDDKPNILENAGLHIEDLTPSSLWQTFFANQGQTPARLFRPLPCLTLALNWYWGGDDPFGYHLVNLLLHLATAWVLYLTCRQLLDGLDGERQGIGQGRSHSIALLAAALWAVNPVQTQAVTYIVQRMAQMAALFYLLSLLFFVLARRASRPRRRWVWGAAAFGCFLAGLGCKENVVLLPFALVLVEWVFFRGGRLEWLGRPWFWAAVLGTALAMLAAVLLLTHGDPLQVVREGYAVRPYSMGQRLLTQPRVVLGYLSQLLYPLPGRLSIEHDVVVSTGLWQPWTTLPAMGALCLLAALGVRYAGRLPLASLAILFFLLNHAVESSLLPLELVFEHRNYLPSFFLFLPLAYGISRLLAWMRGRQRLGHAAAAAALALVIVGLGLGTRTRNLAWATEASLWGDAALKAPNHHRPLMNLAVDLAWRPGATPADRARALALLERARGRAMTRRFQEAEIVANMAGVYAQSGNMEKAVERYREALAIAPHFLKARHDLARNLLAAGRLEESEHEARRLVREAPHSAAYLNLHGRVLLWGQKPREALELFRRAWDQGDRSAGLMQGMGIALTRLGALANGAWFFGLSAEAAPDDMTPLLLLMENRMLGGREAAAAGLARTLAQKWPAAAIAARMAALGRDFRTPPMEIVQAAPVVRAAVAAPFDLARPFQDP